MTTLVRRCRALLVRGLFRLSCALHRAYVVLDGCAETHPCHAGLPADALFTWADGEPRARGGAALALRETLDWHEPYTLHVVYGTTHIDLNVSGDVLRDLATAIRERTVSGFRHHVWHEPGESA